MWFVIFIIVILLFSKLDDIIELYQSKNPDYQKKKEQERLEQAQEQAEIVQQLKASINLECQIESEDILHVSNRFDKINATIINVDDDWVELIIGKKRRKRRLILRIGNISSVSRIL